MDDGDLNKGRKIDDNDQSLDHYDVGIVSEPYLGMEFDSKELAKVFYEDYAKRLGFRTHANSFNRSKGNCRGTSLEFLCSVDGLRKRTGARCAAMLRVELRGQNQNKWIVTKFVNKHSHSVINPNEDHYNGPQKHSTVSTKYVVESCQGLCAGPSGMLHVTVDGNCVSPEINGVGKNMSQEFNHTIKNFGLPGAAARYPNIKRSLGREAQNLLDYFKKMQAENPGFYYAIQLDEENRMANAFWADSRSRTSYSYFGDAVVLDTMYVKNQHKVPFASFTGVNHHGQSILFGCALLFDESEATFVWLFKTFLAAMDDSSPVSLSTDNDRVIQAAAARVFPNIRCRVNKWHVLRQGQDRIANVCSAHPDFQVDLSNCLSETETVEEFESFWASILEKYDLKRNDWLQAIYNSRREWVPVYFRDSFFAAVFPSQELQNSFLDGFVNQQTTLPMFFMQYERALENSFEREMKADFGTLCTSPMLRTPSPMEKQAANLYTKRLFSKFQEELVETFVYTASKIDAEGDNNTYRVAKFEDDHKAFLVSLNISEQKATCSCHMFEYCGILCRHILTVFTVTNILTLPSHYIIKRWTRDAKSGDLFDEQNKLHDQESLTKRYSGICRQAFRYAEEGAISSEACKVAISCLKEGGKKIASVNNSIAKIAPPNSQDYDEWRVSTLTSEMTPLLWPQHDEIICCSNPYDASDPGQPNTHINASCVSPISINHEDDSIDSTMNLPHLKSMTWVMENKSLTSADRIAIINLKLQDYSTSEIKFSLSKITLEPMLRSMACISEQLSTTSNKVAVINLKLQDIETFSGESEVKFHVSRDTLGAMLRSMTYIREQLCSAVETKQDNAAKRQRK